MAYQVEHTDTFAGEANYSWVIRERLELSAECAEREIVRQAKALIGETGAPHRKTSYGDMIQLDYPGRCVRTFIYWING